MVIQFSRDFGDDQLLRDLGTVANSVQSLVDEFVPGTPPGSSVVQLIVTLTAWPLLSEA